jgi:hypothetical protein
MRQRSELRKAHIAGTVWFILAVGYILVLELRQAGARWWIVFSLSGHGVLIVSILVSLYLFAIFRGISTSQNVEIDHPLTSSTYYAAFYLLTPFLGGLAGCLGMIGTFATSQFLLGIALGTLGITFLVWVILDPLIGLLEMLLPSSRKHRAIRQAEAKAERERKQRDRERLLNEVVEQEEVNRRRWRKILEPEAERLAGLLAENGTDLQEAEREAIDIGVRAWQTGGIVCMRELRDSAIRMCRNKKPDKDVIDYISFWWDGIGNWRAKPLGS